MMPYQPNSDALPPPAFAEATAGRPLALPALPVDPLCPLPLGDAESFFARVISSFFSDLAFASVGLDFGFAVAFATSVFLGVGLGIGFGVVFARNAGVTLGFGSGVAVAIGFGVAVGNSISL